VRYRRADEDNQSLIVESERDSEGATFEVIHGHQEIDEEHNSQAQ
jgi:hypothetical protein